MTVDISSVPDDVVERVVAKYVRLWSCDECGNETYRITDTGSGTGRSCPECQGRMIVEIDPCPTSHQPSL